jgi:hypothetical protein
VPVEPAVAGSGASIIHSETIAIGMKASEQNVADRRGQPHFVQPPEQLRQGHGSPAPAIRP